MKIDVIIPVYKPTQELFELLDKLKTQTVPVHRIILMNTEEKHFSELTCGMRFAEAYPNVEVHHLSKREFDHGATRRRGVAYSDAEIFVMMTQDAMPADAYLIEKLTENLRDEVAVAYGRQLPAPNADELERVSRRFNYPPASAKKSLSDLRKLGIKTYFCSDVCAAYRRDVYERLGGFVKKAIFNEDMIFAAGAVQAGYSVYYAAEARVLHSHNYTNMQQLKRNFDLGVSQAQHPEVFADVPSESEGKKMVKETWKYLRKQGKLHYFPKFCVQCVFKYTGYLLGKNYEKLPESLVLALTTNKAYFFHS